MSAPLLYLDTSAWLKLYVEEAGSEAMHTLVTATPQICTHLIAYAELRAALAKATRMQRLSAADKAQIIIRLDEDWQSLNVVLPTDMLIRRAGHLCDLFGLRAYDSIHLAAAEALSFQIMPQRLSFACFDHKLNAAAHALGMGVLSGSLS